MRFRKKPNYLLILIAATIFWIVFQSWQNIVNTYNLNNYYIIDTSTMIQSMTSAVFDHQPFMNTVPGGSFFRVHASPILFILLPFYSMWPGIQSLSLIMITLIYSATIPLYLLGIKRLKNELVAFMIALSYLFYPAIATSPFESVALFSGLAVYTYYFLDQRQYARFAVAFLLMMSTIEFSAIMGVAFGIFVIVKAFGQTKAHHLIFSRLRTLRFSLSSNITPIAKPFLLGIILIAVAGTFFYLQGLMNDFFSAGTHNITTNLYGTDVGSLDSLLMGIHTDPQGKLRNFLELNGPYLFLAFLDPVAIRQLPWFSAQLISVLGGYWTFGNYYNSFIFPFVAIGAIEGMRRLSKYNEKGKGFHLEMSSIKKLSALILILMIASWFSATGIPFMQNPVTSISHSNAGLAEISKVIPANGDVFTYVNELPVVSAHSWDTWYYGTPKNYTLFSTTEGPPYPLTSYGYLASSGSFLLYEKNYTGPPVMNNFYYSVSPFTSSSSGAPYTYTQNLFLPQGEYELTAIFHNTTNYVIDTVNQGNVSERYYLNTDYALIQPFQVSEAMQLEYVILNASMTYGYYGVSSQITTSLNPSSSIGQVGYGSYATDLQKFNYNIHLDAGKTYYFWVWTNGYPAGLYIPLTNGTGLMKNNLTTNFQSPMNGSMQFNLVGIGKILHSYTTDISFTSSVGASSNFTISEPNVRFTNYFSVSNDTFNTFSFKSGLAYGDFSLSNITIASVNASIPGNYFMKHPYQTLGLAVLPAVAIGMMAFVNPPRTYLTEGQKSRIRKMGMEITSVGSAILLSVFLVVFTLGYFYVVTSFYSTAIFSAFGTGIGALMLIYAFLASKRNEEGRE